MTTTTYGIDHYYMDPNGCLVYYETSPNCVVIPPPPPPPAPPSGITTQPTLYNGLLSFLSAVPLNYEQVLVKWQEPQTAYLDWRLVKSRYGFPVDENDGTVLLDTDDPTFPGFQYLDNAVIPGTYNYYAIYLLVPVDWPAWVSTTTYAAGATVVYGSYVYQSNISSNTNNAPSGTTANNSDWDYVGSSEVWYRSGFAACLSPWDYESAAWIKGRIPNYFVNQPNQELTTSDPIGNKTLNSFLNIIGWGIDYLKTAMFVAQNVNNPEVIPENWLYRLAQQLGLPYEPEISSGVLRTAVAEQPTLIRERGTLQGIEAYITALTGWAADIRPGVNLMLEDDQAHFIDPQVNAWSSKTNYSAGEMVTYPLTGTPVYVYQTSVSNNLNTAPSGSTSTSNNWTCLYYAGNATLLANSATGWINTWEPRNLSASNDVAGAGALKEAVGILDRTKASTYLKNGLLLTNESSATATMDLQSISRTTADITASNAYANRTQVIGDGIPVPYTIPSQAWSATTQYPTGSVVTYNGQPYLALKSSKNVTPPTGSVSNVPTDMWQPIGYDQRIALMMSGYAEVVPSGTVCAITPYAAWYDQWGNHITNLIPRQTTDYPAGLMYQSFSQGSWGVVLASTVPDVGNYTWTADTSTFTVNGFADGCIYPSAQGTSTRTIARTPAFTGYASAQLGLTFVTLPPTTSGQPYYGYSAGLLVRWVSDTSYFRIDQTAITKNSSGTKTYINHSTPFAAGDRMIVKLNGSTITVYRYNAPTVSSPVNLVQVSTDTSGYNSTSVTHGVIVETT